MKRRDFIQIASASVAVAASKAFATEGKNKPSKSPERQSGLKILVAGEQVTSSSLEIKGFDSFGASTFKKDGEFLVEAFRKAGHEVTWMLTCQVATDFPEKLCELQKYDAVVLSDVGSYTLLFHPHMLATSLPHPNRLKLLAEFVRKGGGLVMVGGWMSFAGIGGTGLSPKNCTIAN